MKKKKIRKNNRHKLFLGLIKKFNKKNYKPMYLKLRNKERIRKNWKKLEKKENLLLKRKNEYLYKFLLFYN